jgi:hypothetical protein
MIYCKGRAVMLAKLFFSFLSQTPLLNFTSKGNFGAANSFSEISLFSLAFLNLGILRVYFISYDNTGKKIHLLNLVFYDRIALWPTKEHIELIVKRNEDKLVDSNLESVEYKLSQELERHSTIFNKIPNYITIIFFLLPVLWGLLSAYSNILLSLISTLVATYYLSNAIIIASYFLSVKDYTRSTFKELLENQCKAKYFDWQTMSRENDFLAGLVRNLERVLLVCIVFVIISGGFGLIDSLRSQSSTSTSGSLTNIQGKNSGCALVPILQKTTITKDSSFSIIEIPKEIIDTAK